MKKVIYALMLPLVVAGGLVFANRAVKNDAAHKPLSAAARIAHRNDLKKWEASPDGIRYKKWEASPDGIKAHASVDKIRKQLNNFTNMDAVITAISRPSESSGGFGLMVRIGDDDYIVNYRPEKPDWTFLKFNDDFNQLNSLKVNDKIVIKSHSAGYLGKGSHIVLTGDYIERDNKVIFKRDPHKGGC